MKELHISNENKEKIETGTNPDEVLRHPKVPAYSDDEYRDAPSRASEESRWASGYEVPYQHEESASQDSETRRSATYGTYGHNARSDSPKSTSYSAEEKAYDYAEIRRLDRERNASNLQGEFAGRRPKT